MIDKMFLAYYFLKLYPRSKSHIDTIADQFDDKLYNIFVQTQVTQPLICCI